MLAMEGKKHRQNMISHFRMIDLCPNISENNQKNIILRDSNGSRDVNRIKLR